MKFTKTLFVLPLAACALSACETPYSIVGASVSENTPDLTASASPTPPSGSTPTPTPPPVVCDPFNNGTQQDAKNGIKAQLTYVDDYEASKSHLRSTADYEPGMPDILTAPADIFLSKLDVPLRAWDSGFMMTNGELLKKSDGESLFEGFSLRMSSTFIAPNPGDEGDYQFAWISDDGAILEVDTGNGFELLVNNDGVHAQKTACAERSVRIRRNVPLAFRAKYFQGPRYHIALQLLWRKVDAPASSGLTCTGSGFVVVPPEAYRLPGNNTNPCAK